MNRLRTLMFTTVASIAIAQSNLPTSKVDDVVRLFQQQTGSPGVAVAIVQQGRVVHAKGYGQAANGAPITPNTPLRIASMSKSFTALAVMQLVQAGRVNLDTPLKEYLPVFSTQDPRSDRVTPRHLLHHTSGLSDPKVNQGLNTSAVTTPLALQGVQKATLTAEPGTRLEYANINYDLAGLLVQQVSGQPLSDYLQEWVFAPLGMQALLTPNCATIPSNLSQGHTLILKRAWPISEPPGFCLGSGGIIASANDMARWLNFQMQGNPQVLSNELLKQMHQFPTTSTAFSQNYAMGWYDSSEPGMPARMGHGGNIVSYSSHMAFEPSSQSGVVVLLNSNGPAVLLSNNLFRLLNGQPPIAMASPTFTVDLILLVVGLLSLGLGLYNLRNAVRWAQRIKTKPRWRTVLGLLLLLLVPVAVAYTPALMAATPQAWPVLLKLLPSSAALWLMATMAVAVLIARVLAIRRTRTSLQ